MKWYEVVEDLGDGDTNVLRFSTEEKARLYMEANEEWCYYESNPRFVDTDSVDFMNGDVVLKESD